MVKPSMRSLNDAPQPSVGAQSLWNAPGTNENRGLSRGQFMGMIGGPTCCPVLWIPAFLVEAVL